MATNTSNYARSAFMDDAFVDKATQVGSTPARWVSNVARSGQLGTGVRLNKLDGATPMVFSPVQGVVLSLPSMWDNYPMRQEMLRSLVETHAKSITGIDFGYTLNVQDTPVGHDGQVMQVPTNTTRGQVSPSFTFQEYGGMIVYDLFKDWMFDINHPDTNASRMPSTMSDTTKMPGWFMSSYSMSMIFIQYDPSGLPDRIQDACIIVNMFPTAIGDVGFERNIGQSKLVERSITFSGIVQHNDNTRETGRQVAKMLQLHRINYDFSLPGLSGISTVAAGTSGNASTSAIDPKIRSYGGVEYEAGPAGKATPVDGAIKQFRPLYNDGIDKTGNAAILTGDYKNRNEANAGNDKLQPSGAATSNGSSSRS